MWRFPEQLPLACRYRQDRQCAAKTRVILALRTTSSRPHLQLGPVFLRLALSDVNLQVDINHAVVRYLLIDGKICHIFGIVEKGSATWVSNTEIDAIVSSGEVCTKVIRD